MAFSTRGDKPVATVYETMNYNKFKLFDGNRSVETKRMMGIVRSIKKHGYLFEPISVNSDGYISDGQGRLAALRYLDEHEGIHYPLRYTLAKKDVKLELEECIVLNSCNVNWSVFNYVRAHAIKDMSGNQKEYQELYDICQEYAKECGGLIPTTNIIQMCWKHWGAGTYTMVKDGLFRMRRSPEEVRKILDYFVRFAPFRPILCRHYEMLSTLLCFIYTHKDIDEERMLAQVKRLKDSKKTKINYFDTIDEGLKELERIYNWGYKEDEKICIRALYDTMIKKARKEIAEERLAMKKEKAEQKSA